jgi:DNA-binding NtrC family response regulator
LPLYNANRPQRDCTPSPTKEKEIKELYMTHKAKILIIDDEDVICNGCKQTLEKDGFEVDYAQNGIVGLAKLHDKAYDIVLIDLMMPQIKGLDVLESVRRYDPDIVKIIITGFATEAVITEALHKGAYDYLAKPFSANELREIIQRAFQARKNNHPQPVADI